MRGHLDLSTLWAQHNEACIFFPNLAAIVLARATRWNDFAFYLFSAGLLTGTVLVIIKAMWSDIKASPLWFVFIPLVGFTLARYENTLWAFQIAWFIVLFCTIASLGLLARDASPTIPRVALAVALGAIGSYSLEQGLLVWPVGLVVLFATDVPMRVRAMWAAAGAVVIAGFFIGYSSSSAGVLSPTAYFHHLGTTALAFYLGVGNIVPSAHVNLDIFGLHIALASTYRLQEVIGALITLGGVVVVIQWFKKGRQSGARAFTVPLVLVGLGFNLMLIPSRLYNNLGGGLPSRYTTMTWPLVVGVCLALVTWYEPTPQLRARVLVLRLTALVLVAAQVYFATSLGIASGQGQSALRRTSADILANVHTAPNYLILPYLFPGASYVRQLAAFLEKNQMASLREALPRRFANSASCREANSHGLLPSHRTCAPGRRDEAARKAWVVLSAIYVGSGSYLAPDVTSTSSDGLINRAVAQPPPSAIAMSFWSPHLLPRCFLLLTPRSTWRGPRRSPGGRIRISRCQRACAATSRRIRWLASPGACCRVCTRMIRCCDNSSRSPMGARCRRGPPTSELSPLQRSQNSSRCGQCSCRWQAELDARCSSDHAAARALVSMSRVHFGDSGRVFVDYELTDCSSGRQR
jgi:hypothetical protein